MRVQSQLTGAHMILQERSPLALRAYYPVDMARLEKESSSVNAEKHGDGDIDGIIEFSRSFQWSFVFFVVPDNNLLEDANSFVQRAMNLVDAADAQLEGKQTKTLHMLVVADTDQLISSIMGIADAIAPHRCAMRAQFERKTRIVHFCEEEEQRGAEDDLCRQQQQAAASRVATAVREFGDRVGFPLGEADILLRVCGNLTNLAIANHTAISNIPVEARTKRVLRHFFLDTETRDVDPACSSTHNDEIRFDTNPLDDYVCSGAILSPPPFGNQSVMTFQQAPFRMPEENAGVPFSSNNDGVPNYHPDLAARPYQQSYHPPLEQPHFSQYHATTTPASGFYSTTQHAACQQPPSHYIQYPPFTVQPQAQQSAPYWGYASPPPPRQAYHGFPSDATIGYNRSQPPPQRQQTQAYADQQYYQQQQQPTNHRQPMPYQFPETGYEQHDASDAQHGASNATVRHFI